MAANFIDTAVAWFNPIAGLRRAQARRIMAHYEAAKPGRLRQDRRDNSSPNALTQQGAAALRAHARYLERNHDLSRGALRVLVNNVIGPHGIGVEPQPRRADGSIHEQYAAALSAAYKDWQRCPEVTQRLRWPIAQRLLAYTWLRDGEVFAQELVGPVQFLDHGTKVPYSLELFEPDFVPLDLNDDGNRIRQGIQLNAWGRPTSFYVFKRDPREGGSWISAGDLKPIPASRMLHLAVLDRLHQLRGVSEFASVITRIEDLKDYEESERIAAKVAASLTAYVKRGSDPGITPPSASYDTEGKPTPRELRMQPGMILDTLLPGEEVGLIDSKRPNPALIGWRAGQLRAYAAGIGASYSSVSRNYDGTYSAQRQELVEQWVHYAVLADEFVGMICQPVYERFVQMAALSGVVPIPADVVPGTEDDCLFVGQSMPWIDPLKEANAFEKLAQAGFVSEPEIIRRSGRSPRDTMEQMAQWRQQAASRGLVLSSDAANAGGASAPAGIAGDGTETDPAPGAPAVD